jgi:cell fate regulator YaaT (PSP1 superfamily)
MSHVLGLKFRTHGSVYYFTSGPFVVALGDYVLVKTEQGMGLAEVTQVREDAPPGLTEAELKPIYRLANEEDVAQHKENLEQAREAQRLCRDCIQERKLDMRLVDVEVFHDRGKIVFYFTAPGRIDFRELVKDLVKAYHTRIELRQIGVRHETQMIGALGNCGQVCCCKRFMRKFNPVTIKMAKDQNLFLNPAKISGICGRLLCCLGFEQHNYEEFQGRCPKVGKRFLTAQGPVRILRTNLFRETVSVQIESGEEKELSVEEWNVMRAGASELRGDAPQGPSRGGADADRAAGEAGRGQAGGQSGAPGAAPGNSQGQRRKRPGKPRPRPNPQPGQQPGQQQGQPQGGQQGQPGHGAQGNDKRPAQPQTPDRNQNQE